VFKGLLTSETNIGVGPGNTTGGDVEAGGGFCTFSTTFAIPDSVLANLIPKLRAHDHPQPPSRLAMLFNLEDRDPDPLVGVIPISESSVVISVPDLIDVGPAKSPMFINAQGTGKSSIEAHGHSSFLVTCNQLAAGAIAGSLEQGVSPFTVAYTLKEQFYIEGCTIKVVVDVDKVYDAVSIAISTGGFLGIDSGSLSAAYSSLVTSGGITTDIKMDAGVLTDEQKKWIQNNVDDMRKKAFDLVKQDIFDWDPSKGDTQASADRGWASSLFGGTSVSLKANFQRRSIKYEDTIRLTETIAIDQTVSGDLNDLMPAVKADLHKYLAIVDIGEWFKKLQVAGMCAVNFGEKLADGTDLRDPIVSVQLEAAYPDYDRPVLADGTPNLVTRGQGFHYTIAETDPTGVDKPAVWTADNAKDIVNISWLRLDKDVPGWPADQVRLRSTLVYDGNDPRLDLAGGGVTYTSEQDTARHAPILTAASVGYVFVHFTPDRMLPKDNVSLTLTCTIADRTDTLTITKANQRNVIWEIFSDKFIDADSFTYTLACEVVGPNFTDDPVQWDSGAPITVALPKGRTKYVNPLKLPLPPVPAAKVATVNGYIRDYPAS